MLPTIKSYELVKNTNLQAIKQKKVANHGPPLKTKGKVTKREGHENKLFEFELNTNVSRVVPENKRMACPSFHGCRKRRLKD
jgi:hypothetical protein